MSADAKIRKPSAKAKTLSARLMAVQALYQSVHNKQGLKSVTDEFLSTRVEMEIDGETIVKPDGVLFKKILESVQERGDDLAVLIDSNIKRENKDLGILLRSLLTCAAAELLANPESDPPVIINDYLNVAESFFDSGEKGLINGILDAIAKAVRP